MLRWVLSWFSDAFIESIMCACFDISKNRFKTSYLKAVPSQSRKYDNTPEPTPSDITLEDLLAEQQRAIEDEDDVFEHGDHVLRRPKDAPNPHCFGFASEIPSIPEAPPPAPNVDHLFAAREAEEANRTCCAGGCFHLAEAGSPYCSSCHERNQ